MKLSANTLKCLAVAATGAAIVPLISLSGPAVQKESVAIQNHGSLIGGGIIDELRILGVETVKTGDTTITLKKAKWKTLTEKQRSILSNRLIVERAKCHKGLGDSCPGCGLG